MTPDAIAAFEQMQFRPHATWPDTWRARLPGGVEVNAVTHPLRGIVLMGHYVGPRSAVDFEEQLPVSPTASQLAEAVIRMFEQIGACDPAWKAKFMHE